MKLSKVLFLSLKKVKIESKDTYSYLLEKSSGKKSNLWHFFNFQKSRKKGCVEVTDPYSLVT